MQRNIPTAKLRQKPLSNGRIRLYLDFYPAIRYESGRMSRREFLDLYLIEKPTTKEDQMRNRNTEALALSICSKRNLQLLNHAYDLPDPFSLKKDFIQYFKEYVDKAYNNSKGNYNNYKSAYEHFYAFVKGKCLFGDVNKNLCVNFLSYLLNQAKNLKYKNLIVSLNVNSCISYFNKFCLCIKLAVKNKYLPGDILADIELPREQKSFRSFLMPNEVKQLLQTDAPNLSLRGATIFAIFTGLRFSDIRDMTWKSYHQNSTVRESLLSFVQNKTQTNVNNPIPTNLLLKNAIGEIGEPLEKVFPDLKYSRIYKDLPEWVKNAGINKHITFHCLRHTYATLLLYFGVDIFTCKYP